MNSRDRSIIAVLVLIVIAIGGFLLVVAPKHHQSGQLQSQITSEQSDLRQTEARVQSDLSAEAQYSAYAKQLTKIKSAVPSDAQIPELINQLQAASTQTKISLQGVSVSPSSSATAGTSSTAAFPSQSFNLSFTGSYFSVARLLGRLAAFVRIDDTHFHVTGRLISISTLSLTPGSGSSSSAASSGMVTAAVTALDYDVPTGSLSDGSAAVSSSTPSSTATPAAEVARRP